jgi:hypothetical protein
MSSLNNAEYYQKVEAIFKKVFIKSDDCEQPLRREVEKSFLKKSIGDFRHGEKINKIPSFLITFAPLHIEARDNQEIN